MITLAKIEQKRTKRKQPKNGKPGAEQLDLFPAEPDYGKAADNGEPKYEPLSSVREGRDGELLEAWAHCDFMCMAEEAEDC
jgi:hypothetical protein